MPIGAALLPLMIAVALPAQAQKGTGEATGLARQGAQPAIETMSGTIKDIKVGPCKDTTGQSVEGMHLLVQTLDKRTVNLHLGPSDALDGALKSLTAGQTVTFDAFRTNRLPKDAYIAKRVTTIEKTLKLRDDDLRPVWAAGPGGGQGAGQGPGGGKGRGACVF
jgi:hypothetical protein